MYGTSVLREAHKILNDPSHILHSEHELLLVWLSLALDLHVVD